MAWKYLSTYLWRNYGLADLVLYHQCLLSIRHDRTSEEVSPGRGFLGVPVSLERPIPFQGVREILQIRARFR